MKSQRGRGGVAEGFTASNIAMQDVTFSNVHIQAEAGFKCTNAKEIAFHDVIIDAARGPALSLVNCSDVDTGRLRTLNKNAGMPLIESPKN
jgi:hypothetical protein